MRKLKNLNKDDTRIFCPLCECERPVEGCGPYRGKGALFLGRALVGCTVCGLVFIDPMPAQSELDDYYRNVWLKDEATRILNKDEAYLVYRLQAVDRVRYMARHLKLHEGLRVLDVGAGSGCMYDALTEYGVKALRYVAVEPSPDAARRLADRGITVSAGMEGFFYESGFDLVLACFVLEHVTEPVKFLKSMAGRLRKGGFLFLDIPDRDDTFKDVLDPHVLVFNPESLAAAAERAGLDVVHMTGHGVGRSELVRERDAGGKKRFALRLLEYLLMHAKRLGRSPYMALYEYYAHRYYKFSREGTERWWLRAVLIRRDDENGI
jgi:SAM-dependent methyltransferase